MQPCPKCNGSGIVAKLERIYAGRTSTSGPVLVDNFSRMLNVSTPLRVIGAIEDAECPRCKGKGEVRSTAK